MPQKLIFALVCLLGTVTLGKSAVADIFVETYPIGTFKAQSEPQLVNIYEMFKAEEGLDTPTGNESIDIEVKRLRTLQARFSAGYIPIGDLRADDERCNDAPCSRVLRKVMKRARRAGADLVYEVFSNDRERRGTRSGKCLDWTTTNARQYYCPNVGGASCRYINVKQPYCLRFETVLSDKVKRERSAHYDFWRNEPALAKDAYLAAGLAAEVLKMNKNGVDLWLEHGADIRYRHAKAPITRLMYVTRHKKGSYAEGKGGPTDEEIDALRAQRLDFVRFLVSRGAAPDPRPVKSWYIQSPLIRALNDNDYEMVRLLLESGASALTPRLSAFGRRGMTCDYDKPCTVGTAFFNDEDTEQRIKDLLIEYELAESATQRTYKLSKGAGWDYWDWQGW